MNQVECYVEKYGDSYRDLIEDALSWIRSRETEWGIVFDRAYDDSYIEELVSRATPPKEQNAIS